MMETHEVGSSKLVNACLGELRVLQGGALCREQSSDVTVVDKEDGRVQHLANGFDDVSRGWPEQLFDSREDVRQAGQDLTARARPRSKMEWGQPGLMLREMPWVLQMA